MAKNCKNKKAVPLPTSSSVGPPFGRNHCYYNPNSRTLGSLGVRTRPPGVSDHVWFKTRILYGMPYSGSGNPIEIMLYRNRGFSLTDLKTFTHNDITCNYKSLWNKVYGKQCGGTWDQIFGKKKGSTTTSKKKKGPTVTGGMTSGPNFDDAITPDPPPIIIGAGQEPRKKDIKPKVDCELMPDDLLRAESFCFCFNVIECVLGHVFAPLKYVFELYLKRIDTLASNSTPIYRTLRSTEYAFCHPVRFKKEPQISTRPYNSIKRNHGSLQGISRAATLISEPTLRST